ncbi:alanine racemase [Arcobacter sp. YIC-80]|uniref:alanine racemase n=1 Tax=Arcobacter sp. YIC-80 TaxID=3376683 RepID=UPI00384E069E
MAKIQLNKNNLFHNLEIIKNQVGSKDKVAVVLKDNAYGHGLLEIATMAKEFGIKKAVVRNYEEAIKIEKLFDYILILAESNFPTYSHSFHIALNSLENISDLPKNANVHIKVDTGMHRNGISINELEECIYRLCKKNVNITGVFTHHRNADSLTTEFFWQNENFKEVKTIVKSLCEELSLRLPAFHSCNSSALFRHNHFDEDFARVGIATYGYIENQKPLKIPSLKPVLSLWANKISTRKITKGQAIGYGGTYIAKEDMMVSTYDLGYGDGFLRLNEKNEYFTPKGYKILGRVSMDNLSLNSQDEEVCIFEDVKVLANIHNTITYEITTTLNTQIPRSIV